MDRRSLCGLNLRHVRFYGIVNLIAHVEEGGWCKLWERMRSRLEEAIDEVRRREQLPKFQER